MCELIDVLTSIILSEVLHTYMDLSVCVCAYVCVYV